MDGDLVGHAAGPEPVGEVGAGEVPARPVGVGVGERGDGVVEHGGEALERRLVVGEAHEAVVAGRGVEALPHEDGGALEHLAGVADQAADVPAGAGGDGGVEPGGPGRVEQGEAVTVQVGDVIHRRVLHRVGGGRLSTRGGAGTRCVPVGP